jgi:hypothetical protein
MKYLSPFAVAIALSLIIQSCKNGQVNPLADTIISVAVPTAESTVLRFTITDATKRTAMANLLTFYANAAVRATSGNPTPDQFVQNLHTFIPQNIRDQYPELLPMADSIVLLGYNWIYSKYKDNVTELYNQVGILANAIAAGAAPYTSHN